MTLPKAPPPRRFHLPPPAPRRAGATPGRLRSLVRRHEEEERPFDPGRAPDWRGSSKDLVVNASGFRGDLQELVHEYYPKLRNPDDLSEEQMVTELFVALKEESTDDALKRADELLEGFGVESVGPGYLYVNFGDSYASTIAWSRADNKIFVAKGGWADLAEENEASAFDDAWMNWLASEFEGELESAAIGLDPDHDDDTPVPGGVQEKVLKLIEVPGHWYSDEATTPPEGATKELFQSALSRAQGVGGKYPEIAYETDGINDGVFVTHLPLIAEEAADMLAEGWEPGKWAGHSKRKGGHTPNHARVWEAWDDNNNFLGDADTREEAREIRRSYLRKKYGQEPDLEYVDQGVADTRREDDETVSYGQNGGPRRRTRVGTDTLDASLARFGAAAALVDRSWGDILDAGYPFKGSFDELAFVISGWVGDALRARGSTAASRIQLAEAKDPVAALEDMYGAALILDKAWQDAGNVDVLGEGYPFKESFEEATFMMGEWLEAVLDADKRIARHTPNARDSLTGREYDPSTQDAFIRELDKHLGAARDRQVRYRSGQGTLYVNFYNLPAGVGSGGAEAENNRLMLAVREQPGGNVRVELVNSVFPREYRLRAKAGTVEKIAAYAADYLNKIASEIPPRFTHTHQTNASRAQKFKVGDVVHARWFVQGYPVGLSADTRAVVREVRPREQRMRVERDDGREGSWWLSFDAVRRPGDP